MIVEIRNVFFKEKVRLVIHYYILELLFIPHNQPNQLPEIAKQKLFDTQIMLAKESKFL
jgi:hypothetical protein